MWVDGRVYYGMWKDGHQHGEGTIVLPNMTMKKYYWEHGKKGTDKLELTEGESAQIADYVKKMQQEDAQERRALRSSGGGVTQSQIIRRKASSSRRNMLTQSQ